jgi:hypothetical protein
MGYEFIKVEKKGHLTILTINRPERMNALHPPGSKELNQAFDEFAGDPEAWVAQRHFVIPEGLSNLSPLFICTFQGSPSKEIVLKNPV